ncbi:hypothetical protein DFP72DRAFT_599174 [Ephemerocybe angulata]|uniref:HMG box domain-containing protein n=1 Tax=Ephemerocybe angulata TaxID=980116 RepID=A0A8H6IDG6_9AGAR|nr:hypothetical protein DFP72DRAFT_599174 [Tulosesus angulatus]
MSSPTLICRPFSDPAHQPAYDDQPHIVQDADQMIFDMDADALGHPAHMPLHWDSYPPQDMDSKSAFSFDTIGPMASYEYGPPEVSPTGSYYEYNNPNFIKNSPSLDDNLYLASWINDPELSGGPSPSSPISIPSPLDPQLSSASSFSAFSDQQYPHDQMFSPAALAVLHPLPSSLSPSSSFEDTHPLRQRINSLSKPTWATQLWDPSPNSLRTPSVMRPSVRHSPLSDGTVRQRMPIRRGSQSSQAFLSTSAPSMVEPRAPSMSRTISRRSESVSISDDRDATVRRKKRSPGAEDMASSMDKATDLPMKSVLKPPKLAPSAWQLYFTDWIQRQQRLGTRKLNVAQAAKEAGQEYASLSAAEKEPYKRRSQAAKETREREHEAYMRTLTPDDIKRENVFRAAQRKAGKSRKGNIKDPNAPKKPLSAYFMFLQRIRADAKLVRDIFGDETETTKQSVLAAAKWRSMTDAERQPFLAQAEQEKMEYEAARRLYEEGTTGYGTNINFSILQGSPAFPPIKLESESEGEGFEDGFDHPQRVM